MLAGVLGLPVALDLSAGGDGQAALWVSLGWGPPCCKRDVVLA